MKTILSPKTEGRYSLGPAGPAGVCACWEPGGQTRAGAEKQPEAREGLQEEVQG